MNKMLKMYIDYVNNFLSVDRFAEHYGITIEVAKSTIARGKVFFHQQYPDSRNGFVISEENKTRSIANAKFFKERHDQRLLAEHSA